MEKTAVMTPSGINDKTKMMWALVTVLWHVLAIAILAFFMTDTSWIYPAAVFLFFSGLFLINVFLLTKCVQSVFKYIQSDKKTAHLVNAFSYGFIKILCLIFILFILFTKIHSVPLQGIFLSLGSIVVLPLLFGLIWSHYELKKEEKV